MFNRWSFAIAWIGLVAVLAGTCGGGASKPKTPQCQLPSDCKDPLICIQTYCVKACNEGRDCPAGARCIKATEGNSCQPFEKVTCSLRSDCTQPLVCGIDLQCRNQCKEDIDCTGGQKCTSVSHLCADPERDKNYDPVTNEFKPVDGGAGGGAGGKDGGGTDGEDGGGNGGADGATACKGPQTLFGNIIQGDPNPNFTSGVGVRSGNQVFIFSGYRTAPDAGAADPDAGTPAGNAVYVQAFNATTGASAGCRFRALGRLRRFGRAHRRDRAALQPRPPWQWSGAARRVSQRGYAGRGRSGSAGFAERVDRERAVPVSARHVGGQQQEVRAVLEISDDGLVRQGEEVLARRPRGGG